MSKALPPDLNKPSGCIHVNHNLSGPAQRLYNCLLAYVQDEIPQIADIPIFSIPKEVLREYMRTRKDDSIKGWLQELAESFVEFNNVGKGGLTWGYYSFIQEPEFKGSYVTFCIARTLRGFIADKKMFAKISLLVERKFKKTKYAMPLYELGLDYRDNKDMKTGKGVTPWFTPDEIREYLGGTDSTKPFKVLNGAVISPALYELKAESDLVMTMETEREKRVVKRLRFFIEDNTVNMTMHDRLKRLQKTLPVGSGTKEIELVELMQILGKVFEITPQAECRTIAGMFLGRREKFDQVCETVNLAKQSGAIKKTLGSYARAVFRREGESLCLPGVQS